MRQNTIAKKLVLIAVLVLMTATGCNPQGSANDDNEEQYTIATFNLGSGFYAYGITVAQVVDSESGITLTPLPQAGGLSNASLLQSGAADLGFVFIPAAGWAWAAEEPFQEQHDRLRGIAGGLDIYYLAEIVAEGAPVRSLQEAVDSQAAVDLVVLREGTMGDLVARRLLGAYGIGYDDIEAWGGSVTHTMHDDMVARFADGRADITIQPVTAGHPTFTELGVRANVNYVPVSDSVAARFTDEGVFNLTEMPASLFPNQDDPVRAISWSTVLLATVELPEDVAYSIAEALYNNPDKLEAGVASLGYFDPEQADSDANVPVPMHEGARAFYDSLTDR